MWKKIVKWFADYGRNRRIARFRKASDSQSLREMFEEIREAYAQECPDHSRLDQCRELKRAFDLSEAVHISKTNVSVSK